MKKAAIAILFFGMMMSFSSCTVHLGEINIDVPWWVVTIFVVIPSLTIACIAAWFGTRKNRKAIYVCQHCQHRFKPGWHVLYSLHANDDYLLTCPHCKQRDWCSMSYNQED